MSCNTLRLFAAALVVLSAAGESHAGSLPFYYNVDSQTLPGGPIELDNEMATDLTAVAGGFQVTLSGDAVNESATQTFDDVLFLNQWDFSLSSGAALSYNSGIWSGGGDTLQLDSPSGFLPMTDTDAPLSFTRGSFTANLASSDSIPYISVGTLGPGQSVPFSYVVDMNPEAPFDLFGSFVSTTPVPEPSTLILAGFGALGLFVAARRRRAGN